MLPRVDKGEEAPTGGRGLFGSFWGGTVMGEGKPHQLFILSMPGADPDNKKRLFFGLIDAG